MQSTQFYTLHVKDIRQETAHCVSVAFSIPEDLKTLFNFQPGQYLTLKTHIEGEEVRRSYSICAAPNDGELRVAVKSVENGKFSEFINEGNLSVGDTLEVMPPLGKFVSKRLTLDEGKYLGIAVGSGITPIISTMKYILQNQKNAEFTLIYGNKNRGNVIFKEALEALKNKYMERLRVYHVFTREKMDTELFNGRLSADKIKQFTNKLINIDAIDEIFICGPEDMIFGLRDHFIEGAKVPASKLHFELFSSPDQPARKSEAWEAKQKAFDSSMMSKVTVRVDGAAFDLDLAYAGENILDAALQSGADLPFACKGGVCCTCRAKLVEGEVEMQVNYALEPDEIENNFILTCQAHPRSERVVVDFDIK